MNPTTPERTMDSMVEETDASASPSIPTSTHAEAYAVTKCTHAEQLHRAQQPDHPGMIERLPEQRGGMYPEYPEGFRPVYPARQRVPIEVSSGSEELSSDDDNNNLSKCNPAKVTTVILGNRNLIFHNGPFTTVEEGEDSSNPIEISSDEGENSSNPIEISSDEAEDSANEAKTPEKRPETPKPAVLAAKPTKKDAYDAAETLPIAARTAHYFALGQRMSSYTEGRLRRIVGDMGSSQEEWTEAQYQLQMRF